MRSEKINELEKKARNIRRNIIEMVYKAQSGHPGGSLSSADILTVLYFNEMNISKDNIKDENRDRFILSKGHASPVLYATLVEKGIINKDELLTFRNINSNLQGHPDMNKTLGVEMTTGSLGQGLAIANGMAIAGKLQNKQYRVYCLVGDGEMQEGEIWEALMASSKYKLDNLCLIIDNNNLQIDGTVSDVMSIYPLKEKLESFGFATIEIDGNNIDEIIKGFDFAKNVDDKPTVIIAKTVKGKGVSFMENNVKWHGKAPNDEEYNMALYGLQDN